VIDMAFSFVDEIRVGVGRGSFSLSYISTVESEKL
jgi:hypothetical protein